MKSFKNRMDIVLLIILLSYFMILLDNSIVFTGTIKIAQDLHLNQSVLSWISNAYSLTFGGFLLLGSRTGDIFGRKKMFLIGLGIFGLGSLFVGLSQSALSIIIARAFQGIGSAILAPTTLALLMDNYTGEARTRAIASYGATAGIGASIGLVIGGLFASLLSWRVGFFINVPISLIMLALSYKYINKGETQKGKIDYLGTITSVLGIMLLVYSIVGEKYNLYALILAIIILAIFIYHEANTKYAIMPLHLFANRERLGAYIARFFYVGAMLSFWFLTPEIMQKVLGFSPLYSGFAFFPLTIINFVVALQVAKLTKRLGNTKLLIVGVTVTLIGMIIMIFFKANTGYCLGIAVPMLFLGAGQGMTLSPLTAAGIANTTNEDAGAASGVVNTVHQVGGSIGLSIVIAISSMISGEISSYNIAMLIATIFLVISLLAVVLLILPVTRKAK